MHLSQTKTLQALVGRGLEYEGCPVQQQLVLHLTWAPNIPTTIVWVSDSQV